MPMVKSVRRGLSQPLSCLLARHRFPLRSFPTSSVADPSVLLFRRSSSDAGPDYGLTGTCHSSPAGAGESLSRLGSVIVASGSRLVFVAGQVAEDGQGNVIGPGDVAVQARHAFDNVGRALAAANARPDQVAKLTIFVVDLTEEHLPAIEAGRAALFNDHKPVDALIGVKTLAHHGCLIEIEAIAVIDGS
jgi:enamine deaminase RidA (YjgF/YER057c/UK114 family)